MSNVVSVAQARLLAAKSRRRLACGAQGSVAPQKAAAKSHNARSPFLTGGRFGTSGSARTVIESEHLPLLSDKQIVLVRHGQTTWNAEMRIQGCSNESALTAFGRTQACFSSPISRAQQCAQLIWEGREAPIQYLPDLSEAYLGWMQGMTNEYAAAHYPDVYESWRTSPDEFEIEGFKPIHRVFEQAERAWSDIVRDPSDVTLVVSHKSVLRAMVCTALGVGPAAFRAVDMHNSGVSVFWVNKNGEAMLQSLNMTSHLQDGRPY